MCNGRIRRYRCSVGCVVDDASDHMERPTSALQGAGYAARAPLNAVLSWPRELLDDHDVKRRLVVLKLQAKLFLHGGKNGRLLRLWGGCPRQLNVEATFETCFVNHRTASGTREYIRERRHEHATSGEPIRCHGERAWTKFAFG